MTHCPGCTGETRSSESPYGHILGCGSMVPPTGHDHTHEHELGCCSPWGWDYVEKVLNVAATALTNTARSRELNAKDVAEALRFGFDKEWQPEGFEVTAKPRRWPALTSG